MRGLLIGLTAASAVVGAPGAALADDGREGVPALDHVFVLVLENHNSFTARTAFSTIRKRRTFRRWRKSTTSLPTTMPSGTRAYPTMCR